MYKKILLLLALISFTVNAQDTIRGKMNPAKNYSYVILNQLNSINKKYMNNATIKDGEFKVAIPKGSSPGMYRLQYDVNKNLYIDVIYNNESIDFEFHPEYPESLVKFNTSSENILFQKYIDDISVIQNTLDSVQVKYFQTEDLKEEKALKEIYAGALEKLKSTQKVYDSRSEGKLVKEYIKANKRYYNPQLIKSPNDYLADLKAHYYDHIDFNNDALKRSSILIDRVMDYILYLTNSNDPEVLVKIRKEAVTESLNKIASQELKSDIIKSIAFMFAQQENKELTDYVLENHFDKLPTGLQDQEFRKMILGFFKTTIGLPAPNIEWEDKGKAKSLANLEEADYYVVVFWSSTCSHCLKEIPGFNEFLADKENIKALAIGMEDDTSKINWIDLTYNFENLTHILGLGKWQSKYAQDYGVTSTPSYFVLDRNKKILAKPYDLKELKILFEKVD